MLTNQTQPTAPVMFCHDSTSIYYPTAPGRVYIIGILALADCDGSDEDYSDSTARGDLSDLIKAARSPDWMEAVTSAPERWPSTPRDDNPIYADREATEDDFADALEQWADWCDRDSVRLDSLDEIKAAIARAA